jgi:hypothetical protein
MEDLRTSTAAAFTVKKWRKNRVRNVLVEETVATAEAHSGKRIEVWFEDEARVGQKGRVCH